MIPIAAIIIFGLFFGNQHAFGQTVTEVQHATGGFGVAVLATLFGYDGWILIANLGGEMKNPQKLLPKAIILGITAVLVIYTLITIGILKFLPANLIHRLGENATAYLATKAFGAIGGKLLSAGIIISMMGTLNGKMITFPGSFTQWRVVAIFHSRAFSRSLHQRESRQSLPHYLSWLLQP